MNGNLSTRSFSERIHRSSRTKKHPLQQPHPLPIKHALWTVGANPTPLRATQLASEQLLEDMIEKNLSILSENWMLIGRQEITPFKGAQTCSPSIPTAISSSSMSTATNLLTALVAELTANP